MKQKVESQFDLISADALKERLQKLVDTEGSQTAAARAINCSQSEVSNFLKGKCPPSKKLISGMNAVEIILYRVPKE